MACMHKAIEQPLDYGTYPMTKAQFDALAAKTATLCIQYNIPVTPETVLSHAEVQPNLGIKQRGKWDFTVLPFKPKLKGARACGDYLRAQVLKKIRQFKHSRVAQVTQHLKNNGSRTLVGSTMIDRIAVTASTGAGVAYSLEQFTNSLNKLPSWIWPILIIVGCAAIFWYTRKIKQARIEDHITGVHTGRPEETILQEP